MTEAIEVDLLKFSFTIPKVLVTPIPITMGIGDSTYKLGFVKQSEIPRTPALWLWCLRMTGTVVGTVLKLNSAAPINRQSE